MRVADRSSRAWRGRRCRCAASGPGGRAPRAPRGRRPRSASAPGRRGACRPTPAGRRRRSRPQRASSKVFGSPSGRSSRATSDAVALLDQVDGALEDRQVREAEEVHLHRPMAATWLHRVLGRRHRLARRRGPGAASGRCSTSGSRGDHDAGGVGAGVARDALELLGRSRPGARPARRSRRRSCSSLLSFERAVEASCAGRSGSGARRGRRRRSSCRGRGRRRGSRPWRRACRR